MLKQTEIAKRLDISDALLSMIISGERNITYKLAKKLNKITRIEVDFWMTAKQEDLKKAFTQIRLSLHLGNNSQRVETREEMATGESK